MKQIISVSFSFDKGTVDMEKAFDIINATEDIDRDYVVSEYGQAWCVIGIHDVLLDLCNKLLKLSGTCIECNKVTDNFHLSF